MRHRNRIALAIFAAVTGLLLAVHGQRVVMTNDEGIILESAQRMVSGARIYVDFFGYMSPGSYWLQALVFRFLGVSLWTGRLIVILDFAAQCALVYWLAARLASWRVAVAVTLTFFGFQVADPAFLTSAHRWDSATLALAGLCLAVRALDNPSWWRWAASGSALGAAVWCTPSMAIVAAVASAWLAISPQRRKNLIPWIGGIALAGIAGVLLLVWTGSFSAFFTQMAWLRQNYSGVNVLPYGSIIGGYGALLEGSQSLAETTIRLMLVACVALPAILPPLAIILGGAALYRGTPRLRRDALVLLLASVAGMALTVFPRADVMHLAFVAALPYVLAACAIASLLPARAASWLALASIAMSMVFASNYVRGWQDSARVLSPAGGLRVSNQQAPEIERLLREVRVGDTLFVYPYMPMQYFLTQTQNPTRYSYLMPGMMTRSQAAEALNELEVRPPEWLLYMQASRQDFLRVFPNGAGLDWRFADLEAWMQSHYRPVEDPGVNIGGYRLWRRSPAPQSAAALR